MNNEYSTIALYNHNAESYKKISDAFKEEDVVAIVHATGTGKSYNALQLAYDNKDKKIVYVVPSNGIIEHIRKIINNNPNLSFERDFPNLEFRTYSSFCRMKADEISEIEADMVILDEFHHIGAPKWGQSIRTFIETHPNIKVFGMTAYTVRDRGTSYERDMANPDTDELFSNKVVSRYDLCDAMIDGVLPKPIYKSAYVNLIGTERILEEKVRALDATSKEYQEYMAILTDVRKRIQEAPSISDVVKRNIKPNGKYIYFCPPSSEDGINDINTIMEEAKKWFLDMGLSEEDIILYSTTSDMGIEGKNNRDAFYSDVDDDGRSVDGKLRVMFAINQYNEGIHAPNVDGVIMGRGTTSDIVYFEQLGRALSVRGETKEKFDEYGKYSLEELLELCKKRDIPIKEGTPKEEIIEKLLAPIIIDLTNNFDFIRELENNLRDRIKDIQSRGLGDKRIIKIRDASFDIEIANQDLFEMLRYVSDRLTMTWEDKYEYAKAYYEHHGSLEVVINFKTSNGYDYDENGTIKLGQWIHTQRRYISPESERGRLLSQIGMIFENMNELRWQRMYKYAKAYYEKHGNLEVQQNFKTSNGYDYDENGNIKLGDWISNQRQHTSLESERGRLLSQIGMRFENIIELRWQRMYEYAKAYYEYHGNLEIPVKFKTNNGYDYDENGKIKLGQWITTQRRTTLPESEHGRLLSQIGIIFESMNELRWQRMYKYAKKYYEKHGNLEVPQNFKTNNGYDYDENGNIKLGDWLSKQRRATLPESENGILFSQIGMRFENVNELHWQRMYECAKKYYEKHGNLEVSARFKTNNGYDYDENGNIKLGDWLSKQRRTTLPESEHGRLLSQIGMRFKTKKIIKISWEEMYKYAKVYYKYHGNLEVPARFKTSNGHEYDDNGTINLGGWISEERKRTLPESKRGQLLSQIGMRFETKKIIKIPWEEMYKYTKTYYEHHGNLEVPARFKTNNGYDYDENGKIKLGQWISNQRRTTESESERGQLLSQIGMIWDVKINKGKIENLCIENNIDMNINKKIISHISIQELKSKIEFLKENGISLLDDKGKLHKIFTMSSANMQVKYGVSLEELINKYYITSMEKGGI